MHYFVFGVIEMEWSVGGKKESFQDSPWGTLTYVLSHSLMSFVELGEYDQLNTFLFSFSYPTRC